MGVSEVRGREERREGERNRGWWRRGEMTKKKNEREGRYERSGNEGKNFFRRRWTRREEKKRKEKREKEREGWKDWWTALNEERFSRMNERGGINNGFGCGIGLTVGEIDSERNEKKFGLVGIATERIECGAHFKMFIVIGAFNGRHLCIL